MFKNYLIVISGPSGVGKATLTHELLKRRKDLVLSVSATTRDPRPGEKNGQDYWFLSKEEFEHRIKEKYFIEWALVHGNYYGTPEPPIRQQLTKGKNVILEIDVQGGCNVKKNFKDQSILFFILPPVFDELFQRLKKRGSESLEEIEHRLQTARLELLRQDEYDYTIINDDIERAVFQLMDILDRRLCNSHGKKSEH